MANIHVQPGTEVWFNRTSRGAHRGVVVEVNDAGTHAMVRWADKTWGNGESMVGRFSVSGLELRDEDAERERGDWRGRWDAV
jgi:plastocyanin